MTPEVMANLMKRAGIGKRFKPSDLIGQSFGSLRVISRLPNDKRRTKWLCECACGNHSEVISYNLIRGNTTSCGCKKSRRGNRYNFKNLTGQTFGDLKVVNLSERMTKTRGAVWACSCSCGQTKEFSSHALTSGNNTTCGSIVHKRSERIGEIPLAYLNGVKQGATKRQLLYAVSGEFLWEIFLAQNRKCALSGVLLGFTPDDNASTGKNKTTASLDRIDGDLGYVPGNVRWVHKDINKMRWENTDEEFLEWCWRCVVYNVPHGENRWDQRFLHLARLVSSYSKDPSTKTGAIIVDQNKAVVSMGYNGMARGVEDSVERLTNRDIKYKAIVHCERNAIIFAKRDLQACTLYTWPFMSCAPCAGMVIQTGITRVVAPKNNNPRWAADFQLSQKMFDEAGVKVDFVGETE